MIKLDILFQTLHRLGWLRIVKVYFLNTSCQLVEIFLKTHLCKRFERSIQKIWSPWNMLCEQNELSLEVFFGKVMSCRHHQAKAFDEYLATFRWLKWLSLHRCWRIAKLPNFTPPDFIFSEISSLSFLFQDFCGEAQKLSKIEISPKPVFWVESWNTKKPLFYSHEIISAWLLLNLDIKVFACFNKL